MSLRGRKQYFKGKYRLPNRLFSLYTRYIHFNCSTMEDGFIDYNTHSQPHQNVIHCQKALDLLEELGVPLDESILSLELSETNYDRRDNLCKEYMFLNKLRNK